MSASQMQVLAPTETSMVALGSNLAAAMQAPLVVYLNGELGMGKTTLARGFVRQSGHRGAVKSPTYTLVEPYEFTDKIIYHFDLYRLGEPEELEYMGIRDYFGENSVCLVEWPERGLGVLPEPDIVITIVSAGSGRRLTLVADTDRGRSVLERLRHQS